MLIAGGGLAAQRCTETLRTKGFEGPIQIVCEEQAAPYDRPPLSKAVLTGEQDSADLSFRSREWYREHDVELRLGVRAVSIDVEGQSLALASGEKLTYDAALIATGSRPRTLPGVDGFENALTLRTIDNAERIRDGFRDGGPVVIIGAGFVGLEVAASARRLGLEVTVIEAAPAPLMRVIGSELGNWFAELHRSEGVEVVFSARIVGFGGKEGRVEWVELEGGRKIACGLLLIAVGIEADTEWLEDSGFDPDGVRADHLGRTAAPNVYAAGDAARLLSLETGDYERSEHWEAAAQEGALVARTMLGLDPAPRRLPSFWTDQYGIRIQTLGDTRFADEIEYDGEPASRNFVAVMMRAGEPVAGLIAGRPRALPELRQRILAAAAETTTEEEDPDGVLAEHR